MRLPATVNWIELSVVCGRFYVGSILIRTFQI